MILGSARGGGGGPGDHECKGQVPRAHGSHLWCHVGWQVEGISPPPEGAAAVVVYRRRPDILVSACFCGHSTTTSHWQMGLDGR